MSLLEQPEWVAFAAKLSSKNTGKDNAIVAPGDNPHISLKTALDKASGL